MDIDEVADEVADTEKQGELTRDPNAVKDIQPPAQGDGDEDSDTPPTAEEWKTMKGYGSFITHDDADAEHIFRVNDMIHVLPAGRDPDEEIDDTDLWLAQIRSIRAHDSDNVWIKAKWFYHPKELPGNAKGVKQNSKSFGYLERISSNQADFISTSACCGLAKIAEYNEMSVEQEEIEFDSFYYRSDYDWQKRALKMSSPPCSICKKAYNPDTDIMHFCPRPGCCRSWHTICLTKANWLIKSSENFLQRMESLDRDYIKLDPSVKARPKKKARSQESKAVSTANDPYARIPEGLLAVARQPIARGGSLGLVGNVRPVVKARTLLQKALRNVEDVPDDWEEKLGKQFDANKIGPAEGALAYQCPHCGEPI